MSGHAAGPKGQLKSIAWALSVLTVLSLVFWLVTDIGLLFFAVMMGWAVVGIYTAILFLVIEPGGNAVGRILVPQGGSTPSVAQHSNIEAMEMRGEYRKAADAYRAAIESSPADIVACEKLGQLAMRELKDFELSVWAYRQAEQRTLEPRRRMGYGIIVAGIYRDNLNDSGKAIVEIRKVLERYPDAPNAAQLRAELDELKARHFEAP